MTDDVTDNVIRFPGGDSTPNQGADQQESIPVEAGVQRVESTRLDPTDVDESTVLEGELVMPAANSTSTAIERRVETALTSTNPVDRLRAHSAQAAPQLPVLAYHGVRTAVTHQRTKTVVRHAVAYPVAGAVVLAKRWRDTHGASRYERQMRAAESAGDQEALRYWQEADVAEKARRHGRTMDWLNAPLAWIKAVGFGLLGLTGLLLVIGGVVAIASHDISEVLGPIKGVISAIAFLVWFFGTYGAVVLTAVTVGVAWYLYQQGRAHAEMPRWLSAPTGADQMDQIPDENTILNALHGLNLPGFNRAVKEGWRIKFIQPPTIDGKGYRAQLALPPSCPVEHIVAKKVMLAHNLVRYPIEVWPTEPSPAVLDLWVAKPGALSGPMDPWPLLADLDTVEADYFQGVPIGQSIRGDVINARLFEANYAVGGMMGSGKSTMIITILLGAMLDPLVDIDVVVMAENADYEAMAPRLRSLKTGPGDDTIEHCQNLLQELFDDLSVRGKALKTHNERAVTREIAEKDSRLRPRIVVIDECQNLFMGSGGAAAIEIASKVMATARKYGVTLMFLTPEPSKDALPRKITSTASNKACYAIGDQMGNDAVLGTGAYKAGISAVGLTPKTDEGPGDVGTCMQKGFTAKPGLLRTFYVSQQDAARVTERAMVLREGLGIEHETPADQARVADPLVDVRTVLGSEKRMKTLDVVAALKRLDAAAYGSWTLPRLTEVLGEYDAAPYKSGGVMQVSTARVDEALADRASTDEDPEM